MKCPVSRPSSYFYKKMFNKNEFCIHIPPWEDGIEPALFDTIQEERRAVSFLDKHGPMKIKLLEKRARNRQLKSIDRLLNEAHIRSQLRRLPYKDIPKSELTRNQRKRLNKLLHNILPS